MPQDDGGPAPGRQCAPRAVARLQGGDSHPGLRHGPRPPGSYASGPEAAAPPLDIWSSDLQRGRSASSSFLYLTLEPRFLNFIAQRNLAWVATDSGRALALASKTPREAIEGFVEVEEPC